MNVWLSQSCLWTSFQFSNFRFPYSIGSGRTFCAKSEDRPRRRWKLVVRLSLWYSFERLVNQPWTSWGKSLHKLGVCVRSHTLPTINATDVPGSWKIEARKCQWSWARPVANMWLILRLTFWQAAWMAQTCDWEDRVFLSSFALVVQTFEQPERMNQWFFWRIFIVLECQKFNFITIYKQIIARKLI